jgi:alpha-acetolactate decarboxylase
MYKAGAVTVEEGMEAGDVAAAVAVSGRVVGAVAQQEVTMMAILGYWLVLHQNKEGWGRGGGLT